MRNARTIPPARPPVEAIIGKGLKELGGRRVRRNDVARAVHRNEERDVRELCRPSVDLDRQVPAKPRGLAQDEHAGVACRGVRTEGGAWPKDGLHGKEEQEPHGRRRQGGRKDERDRHVLGVEEPLRLRGVPIVDPLPALVHPLDKARPRKAVELLERGGLRDPEDVGHIRPGHLTVLVEELQDRDALLRGEGLKHIGADSDPLPEFHGVEEAVPGYITIVSCSRDALRKREKGSRCENVLGGRPGSPGPVEAGR